MGLLFPTTNLSFHVDDSNACLHFKLESIVGNLTTNQSRTMDHSVAGCPQAVQDAITTLKDHLVDVSKTELENTGPVDPADPNGPQYEGLVFDV